MADFAPGIPARRQITSIPQITRARRWPMTVQVHEARRAGRHFDLRLGPGLSWALRYWPEIGQTRLAVRQPTHRPSYMGFEGTIKGGYGAGTVSMARREQVEVLSADDEHVRFNAYPGQRVEEYLLRRTRGHDWILRNITPSKGRVPDHKPKYRQRAWKRLDPQDGEIWQQKMSGAHVLVDLRGDRPRVYSYRQGQRLIQHTQRLPGHDRMTTPARLKGSILRAEILVPGKTEQQTGGVLNAGVWRSRKKGRLRLYVIDVVRWRGRDVEGLAYGKKLPMIDEAVRAAPWLHKPRTAFSAGAKTGLVARIEERDEEGIVAWHPDRVRPTKAKRRPERDVHVVRIFDEKRPGMAGGFEYAARAGGPVIGRVGTGFDHGQKRDMARRPEAYVGLKAKIHTAPGPYAGQKPSFAGWHLDQQLPKTAGCPEGGERPDPKRLTERLARLRAKLRPGDIINTDPRSLTGLGDKTYKALSRLIQGTGYGHSAIYEGRDNVIEARYGRGVWRRKLRDLAECNRLSVVRPRATDAERRRALSHIRSQLGRPFSMSRLLSGGAKPTILSPRHQRDRQAMTQIFCSNLIANAYAKTPFNPDRAIEDTRPVDILKSRLTKWIGHLG